LIHAITREVSPAIGQCELTYTGRSPIDVNLARAQHAEYRQLLTELGCTVIHLPAEPTLPDSVFVEDGAVVLDDLAVITRLGAESRRGETASLRDALAPYRSLAELTPPAILDGGDVLNIDRKIWIGLSTRTNKAGIEQFQQLVKPHDYEVKTIEISEVLHLKSAVTLVAENTVLLNPEWVDPAFDGYRTIAVDPSEPLAANVLRVGKMAVVSRSHPRTAARLDAAGIQCRSVASSELAKAEGALTCCSLLFDVRAQ
jgi:dimethylargininase